jgi:two-component system sensor histidine kinase CiaH
MKSINRKVYRLTFFYVSIIMLVSIGFSIAVYETSQNKVEQTIIRQSSLLSEVAPLLSGINEQERIDLILEESERSNAELRSDLILVNTLILIASIAVCYFINRNSLNEITKTQDAQRRFIADASHELRTPLTAMKSSIEVAIRKKVNDKESKQTLLDNLKEIDSLEQLTESLLALAKTEDKTLKLVDVSILELVQEAVSRVSQLAKDKNIKLNVEVKEDNKLRCDQDLTEEVLVILLDNAIKYSNPNSTISIKSDFANGKSISITDQGIGIPASSIPHIFDRFYRVDNSRTKTQSKGYGIGLSIAKEIMTLHNGTIQVQSDRNSGSTFTLMFK